MRIPIDPQSETPLYLQISGHLKQAILSGSLPPDTRLPSSRQMAEDLGVSRITVNNAFAELEAAGLTYSLQGSGTFVLARPFETDQTPTAPGDDPAWPLWQGETSLSPEAGPVPLLPANPNLPVIRFTGVGDPRHFPVKDFTRAVQKVLHRDQTRALSYMLEPHGFLPLRETLTHLLACQGIQVSPANILVTSGSQQSIALVCQLLLSPGDVIFVEKPTYNFALELFRSLDLQVVGVPIDKDGMQVGLLEPLLQKYHPKLLYTIPNFQNPSGVCMSLMRRRELLVLADRYNLPILEDDFVGDLRFEGRTIPPIKSLDPGGRVIYTGTFSKILMPGLRVGYLTVEGPIFQRLARRKLTTDLGTSAFLQRVLREYLTVGKYKTHLKRTRRIYRQRRDAMLAAIAAFMPPEVTALPVQGGLFLWLQLPIGVDSRELWHRAQAVGVDFSPGQAFFPVSEEGKSTLRLNFAVNTPEEIREGIRRLGKLIYNGRIGV